MKPSIASLRSGWMQPTFGFRIVDRASLPAAVLGLVLWAGTASSGLCWQVTGLYNTGVDDAGQVLPVTAADPHYQVTFLSETGPAYVRAVVYHDADPGRQAWLTPPAGSAWIGPSATGSIYPDDPAGMYVYTLRFTLDLGGWGASAFRLQGLWGSDDYSWIQLNGFFTGYERTDWDAFTILREFDLGGLQAGENVLSFYVWNQRGPSGLLVAGLQVIGPAQAPRLLDTGRTLVFLAGALGVLGCCRRWSTA